MHVFKGKAKVKLPTGKLPKKGPGRPTKQAHPLIGLAAEIRGVLDTYGLTVEEAAELISAYTGEHISRSTLGGWLRGAEPRIGKAAVRKALAAIEKGEGKIPKPRSVSSSEVKQQIETWLESMTHKQIQLAGELPQSTYQAMSQGLVTCEYRRWQRIKSLVTMWRKVARQAGALKKRG